MKVNIDAYFAVRCFLMSVMGIGWSDNHEQKQPTAFFMFKFITMATKINDAYKVSEQTARLIECYEMATALYAKMSDAVEFVYGEMQVDNVLEPFGTKWSEMCGEIEKLISNSIVENISDCQTSQNHVI